MTEACFTGIFIMEKHSGFQSFLLCFVLCILGVSVKLHQPWLSHSLTTLKVLAIYKNEKRDSNQGCKIFCEFL